MFEGRGPARLFGFRINNRVRWGALCLAAAAAGAVALAAKSSDAVECTDSSCGGNGSDAFEGWAPVEASWPTGYSGFNNNNVGPAICGTHDWGSVAIAVDSSYRYEVLQLSSNNAPAWTNYGNGPFSSRPTCAVLDATGPHTFLFAGLKSSDHKIYISQAKQGNNGPIGSNPTALSNPPFSAFSPAPAGTTGPALASRMGLGNGIADHLMMAWVTPSGSTAGTVYASYTALPYNTMNAWTNITGPQLPSGWTIVGAPTIAAIYNRVTWEVIVHAHNSSLNEDGFFQTYIYDRGSSVYFCNALGNPALVWTGNGPLGGTLSPSTLSAMGVLGADPSLNFDTTLGYETLYFIIGSTIWQTSGPLGSNATHQVYPYSSISFRSSPSFSGDTVLATNSGTQAGIAIDTSGNFQEIYSYPDAFLGP